MFCDEHLRRPEPARAKPARGKMPKKYRVCGKAGCTAEFELTHGRRLYCDTHRYHTGAPAQLDRAARVPEPVPEPDVVPDALEESDAMPPVDHDAPIALLKAAGYSVQLACTTPTGPAFFVPGSAEMPGLTLLKTAGYRVRKVAVPRGLFFFVEVA
jgi:hypothetical protein